MNRLWKRALVTLVLCALPLIGCRPFTFRVELANFGNGATDGIWLWKQSSGTTYARQCRIDLSNTFVSGGREVVSYIQSCVGDSTAGVQWQSAVERKAGNPSTVQLVLVYRRSGTTAPHRATAFNAAGESLLSSTSLMF